MRLLIALLTLSFPVPALAQSPNALPCQAETVPEATPWDLVFFADEGLRVDNAALPKPFVDDSGRVHLFYQSGNGPGARGQYAVSDDGLTFLNARDERPEDLAYHPYRVRMPNGIWRMYSWHLDRGELRSRSAGDGVSFGDDSGVRYQLHADDQGWAGIHDEYVDRQGRVVLLYLGDKTGLNNVRRAVSTDNGWTFTFVGGNVLGDSDDVRQRGPSVAYVDQHTTPLANGAHRLFAMRQGCAIYSFLEDEQGDFTQEPGPRVTVQTWPAYPIRSLHDPVVVRLPDGRYRMYVCAALQGAAGEPPHEIIVSATTAPPPGIQ